MVLLVLLCLTNGFQVFFPGNFSVKSFLAAYITLPLFFTIYLGHKLWARTPWILSIETVDVRTDREEADQQEAEDREALRNLDVTTYTSDPLSVLRRIGSWLP